jgi:hypothetical protein
MLLDNFSVFMVLVLSFTFVTHCVRLLKTIVSTTCGNADRRCMSSIQ